MSIVTVYRAFIVSSEWIWGVQAIRYVMSLHYLPDN